MSLETVELSAANTRDSVVLKLFCLTLLLSFGFTPAHALDPNRHLSQLAHTSWRTQDGLFGASPNAIAQTADGYMWIGTESGLFRFDGVRFVSWTEPPGKRLIQPNVYSLLGARDGSLWIGTGGGLAHWTNGDLINYPATAGRVNSIREDQQGAIWMVRSRIGPGQTGPLCKIDANGVRCYGTADGLNCTFGAVLASDQQENLWIGSSDGLCRWRPESSSTYLQKELKTTEGLVGVAGLAIGADGTIWAGIPREGKKFGLLQFANGVWNSYAVPGMVQSSVAVKTLLLDRNNALWIGTLNQGIYRIFRGKADHFTDSDGLSSNSVARFYEDREGNVWVITSKGIDCFRDLRVTTFSVREGLTADGVASVLSTRDGTVWIGNEGALNFFRQGTVSTITARDGLPGKDVTSLFEDHNDRLWVGVDKELAVYQDKRFRVIKRPDGTPVGVVVAITEDAGHDVWAAVIGKGEGLIRIRDFKAIEHVATPPLMRAVALAPDPRSGIWLGLRAGGFTHYLDGRLQEPPKRQDVNSNADPVWNVLVDDDGTVWGATAHGLLRWDAESTQTLSSRNGLPCDSVFALVRDHRKSLWLSTVCGFIAISDSELREWAKQPDRIVKFRVYDTSDGAQTGRTSFRPSASTSPDGRLWFANDSLLQMIDPDRENGNSVAPPVHIEQIVADRKQYAPVYALRLPSLTRDLEIDYTALSFVNPQKVRFRYKLEGHDTDWQDPGARRQAFYSGLRPGKYRFMVIACNNEGLWNEEGAALNFIIAPAWYQTNWFLVTCLFTGVMLVWLLYFLRVRAIERSFHVRLDERLAERTRVAREFHDTLLQTIQGSKMVADDALDKSADLARMRAALERLSRWLGQAMEEGRAGLVSLRASTTQTNDLAASFRRALDDCRMQGFPETNFITEGRTAEMHPIVRDEIYRVGYEAIRNACQHSGATRIEVRLSYSDDLTLIVSDNGKGIDATIAAKGKEGHYGLQGMHERALRISGRLNVDSSLDSGTKIELIVPGSIVFQQPGSSWSSGFRRLLDLFHTGQKKG